MGIMAFGKTYGALEKKKKSGTAGRNRELRHSTKVPGRRQKCREIFATVVGASVHGRCVHVEENEKGNFKGWLV